MYRWAAPESFFIFSTTFYCLKSTCPESVVPEKPATNFWGDTA